MANSDIDPPFDNGEIIEPPIAVEALIAPADAPATASSVPALIPEDQFCEMIAGVFPVIGGMQAMFDPPPYAVWEDAPGFETANPAFRALYRLAVKFPWLNFLIQSEYGWLGDAILVAAFGGQVTMAIMQEARMRHPNRAFANMPPRTAQPSSVKVSDDVIITGDDTGQQPHRMNLDA